MLLRSTSIASADWDKDSQELTVTFQNGRDYTFYDVPEDVYQGLVNAASPGQYFNAVIKNVYG